MEKRFVDRIKGVQKNEWYKTIRLIVLISLGTLVGVLIILGIPSSLGGDAWIGFWGSIAGSIIGGTITIVALKKTIEFEQNKSQRNQISQQKPYLRFKILKEKDEVDDVDFQYYKLSNHIDASKKDRRFEHTIMISNIGVGTAKSIWINKASYCGIELGRISSQKTRRIERENDFVEGEKTWDVYLEKKECFVIDLDVEVIGGSEGNSSPILRIDVQFEDLSGNIYRQECEMFSSIDNPYIHENGTPRLICQKDDEESSTV